MRQVTLLASLLMICFTVACDLRHLPEKIDCWQAKDDRNACHALNDRCFWVDDSTCRGGGASICASACRPSEVRSSCTIWPRDQRACGSGGLVNQLGVFNGPKYEDAWNYGALDRSVWESRIGIAFDPELIASMT